MSKKYILRIHAVDKIKINIRAIERYIERRYGISSVYVEILKEDEDKG